MKYDCVDMLCVGEGENALIDLVHLIGESKDYSDVTNLWVRQKDGSIKKNSITKPVDINKLPPVTDIGIFGEKDFIDLWGGKFSKCYQLKHIEVVPIRARFVILHHKMFCIKIRENFLEKKYEIN